LPLAKDEVARLAERILVAGDSVRSIAPITDCIAGFDLSDAYRVSAAVTRARIARGERPIGWKIGFTNETIWDEYGVHAPIWGPIYDSTLAAADSDGIARCTVGMLVEPRIEPEIAFRFASPPHPDMDETALLGCIDAVAHGFEIVQSIFPGWRFKAADTVAAFALHGRYVRGPLVAIADAERADWQKTLREFSITLFRDGAEIDRGAARNVLGGGPLTALRHFVRGVADDSDGSAVRAGDLVTTGTVTRAFPVKPGERWSTKVEGLPVKGMDITLG
jgi:2-oxo-3-hexenedioate decarboxylase